MTDFKDLKKLSVRNNADLVEMVKNGDFFKDNRANNTITREDIKRDLQSSHRKFLEDSITDAETVLPSLQTIFNLFFKNANKVSRQYKLDLLSLLGQMYVKTQSTLDVEQDSFCHLKKYADTLSDEYCKYTFQYQKDISELVGEIMEHFFDGNYEKELNDYEFGDMDEIDRLEYHLDKIKDIADRYSDQIKCFKQANDLL
ncbi:MAG: hypothetical protein CMC98_02995 [Flavobacteriales bacterium]|nr:hypothetical protein [Flavobacteriales bacterium]